MINRFYDNKKIVNYKEGFRPWLTGKMREQFEQFLNNLKPIEQLTQDQIANILLRIDKLVYECDIKI